MLNYGTSMRIIHKNKVKVMLSPSKLRRHGCIAPLILNLGTRWRRAVNLTPRPLYPEESSPVPNELETGCAPMI